MTDTIKDTQIDKMIAEGRVYGDGTILRDERTVRFLKSLSEAKENIHGPKVEVIPMSPRIKPNDFKNISELQITKTICDKWGETPDTLVALNIAKLSGNSTVDGMIVSEIIDSTSNPPGINKVAYQFARRGDYDNVSFDKTEIIRFEFSELKPNANLNDSSMGDVAMQMPDDGVGKSILADNQFIDPDTGMLVTYFSTTVE